MGCIGDKLLPTRVFEAAEFISNGFNNIPTFIEAMVLAR